MAIVGLTLIGVVVLVTIIAGSLRGSSAVRRAVAQGHRLKKVLSPRSVELLQNPQTRLAEARRLGETRTVEAVPMLRQFTKDKDPEVRRTCVWSLGEIGDKEAIHAVLLRVYDDELAVRIETAAALSKLYGFDAHKGLVDMLEDHDPKVRIAAVNAFKRVLKDKQALKAVIGALADDETKVRVAALAVVVTLEEEDATWALVNTLNDKDAALRLAAAKELAKRRGVAAFHGLSRALGHSDKAVRDATAEAILAVGKPLIPYLKKELAASKTAEGKAAAARLLAKMGEVEVAPAILSLLKHARKSKHNAKDIAMVRKAVSDALVMMGEPALGHMNAEVIDGESSRDAEEVVADACVKIGRPAAKVITDHILKWKLYHDPAELKLWLETLAKIGDPAAMPALNRALAQDIDGMDKLVAETRAAIEKKSGKKQPDPKPDKVAFHAEIPEVQSLNLPEVPVRPLTKEVKTIPDNGVVKLTLRKALRFPFGDGSRRDLMVELTREDGKWVREFWGRAPRYNGRHQPGHVTEKESSPKKTVILLKQGMLSDGDVPGGYGEYEVTLVQGAAGMTGTYKGHYCYKDLEGKASVRCREGKVPDPWRDGIPVASGEHPRLWFRKSDIPVLRARARTELGRRIIKALLKKLAHGKVEDFDKYLNYVTNWMPGMDRALGQALLAILFDDPMHGRRAADTAMLRFITPAYAGEHGEKQGPAMPRLGFGYDMVYNYLTPEEHEVARQKVATLWDWTKPNAKIMMGEGQWNTVTTAVLSLLREKGPWDVPLPFGPGQKAVELEPAKDLLCEGIPVTTLEPGEMLKDLLLATGFEKITTQDPLEKLGGVAKASPTEGTLLEYGEKTFSFMPLPVGAAFKTAGLGAKKECIKIPGAKADTCSYLYGIVDVPKAVGVKWDCSHPLGFRMSRSWINGQEVDNGTTVMMKPGMYRVMVQVWGSNLSPTFMITQSGKSRAVLKAHEFVVELWNKDKARHARTGEMGSVWRYIHKAERAVGRIGYGGLDSLWKLGPTGRGPGLNKGISPRGTVAYGRVMGAPLFRDAELPFVECPALLWSAMGDDMLCYLMPAAPPEILPALVWEFNRRYKDDETLARMEGHFLVAAFCNYPFGVEPKHPDEIVSRYPVDKRRGSYGFWSGVKKGGFISTLFCRKSDPPHISRGDPRGGYFSLRGLGRTWITVGSGGKGERFENIVEVAGTGADGNGKMLYYEPGEDGSGLAGVDMSNVYSAGADVKVTAQRHYAADYSGKSGAPALIAVVDRIQGGGKKTWTLFTGTHEFEVVNDKEFVVYAAAPGRDGVREDQRNLRGRVVSPADAKVVAPEGMGAGRKEQHVPSRVLNIKTGEASPEFFVVMTVQRSGTPKFGVEGEGLAAKVRIGSQTVSFSGEKIVLARP